jgi:hypothetical protein
MRDQGALLVPPPAPLDKQVASSFPGLSPQEIADVVAEVRRREEVAA